MKELKTIELNEAQKVIDAMLAYSTLNSPGMPMAHAVVDRLGVLLCFARMDGAGPVVRRMAENKAYSAIMWQVDTRFLYDLQSNDANFKINSFGEPERQALIPGGNLIKDADGNIIGAVGSSGRMMEDDEEAARAGIAAFNAIHGL